MSEKIWNLAGNSLAWQVKPGQVHRDDIEMSGFYADYIVSYGVNEDGSLHLSQSCYFPTLRTIPNNTHATYCFHIDEKTHPTLCLNERALLEYPKSFHLDGTLTIVSAADEDIEVKRCFYPCLNSRACVERVTLLSKRDVALSLSALDTSVLAYQKGTKGIYVAKMRHDAPETICLLGGQEFVFHIFYTADLASDPDRLPDGELALQQRKVRVQALCEDALVLDSGNATLDAMMRFAKLRAGESIFETLSGKFHSPGGRSYYAATWCNDQIEYAGPHFAMTGDKDAIEASFNAYCSYIPFMSDAYIRLPSSIIAEGLDIWQGAGDRGDAAMYLWGASLFCLYLKDERITEKLYPAIGWCAEYCRRKTTKEGVISSDTDELEGRFPTDGYANLSTSCLCYGGLLAAAELAMSLGDEKNAEIYRARACDLEQAIESYFGADLHGFATYRYSNGYDTLRAWICLPLCMGITRRQSGTLDAMLSPYLWTEEGMLSCERSDENASDTIWDRATLYGMRCAFLSGAGKRMVDPLLRYCHKRLLCDRVPYAVEAYPEGGKRHLSGESALFVRVITEGLFAICPTKDGFSFVPSLHEGFDHLYLHKIRICGGSYDIRVEKHGWQVYKNEKMIATGTTNGKRVMIHE